MGIVNFFHHLFNPHCPECTVERGCKNCETLRSLLDTEKFEKSQLLNTLLHKDQSSQPMEVELPKPITSKHIPWNVRRQMLEAEDRETARLLKKQQAETKQIEELEKELGVENG